MSNLLENITESLSVIARETLQLTCKSIPISKRNKSLKYGDFQIPLKGLKKHLVESMTHMSMKMKGPLGDGVENNTHDFTQLTEQFCKSDYFSRSHVTDDNLFIFLDRHLVFEKVILHILTEEEPWLQNETGQTILVISTFSSLRSKGLSQLRTTLLTQHIARLIEVNGFRVECQELNGGINGVNKSETVQNYEDIDCSGVYQSLKNSQFCESDVNDLVIDFKEFFRQHNFKQGNKNYDKNINRAIVKEDDEKLKMLSLENTFYESCKTKPIICLHVSVASSSFTMQQVDLLWRMIGNTSKQCHLSHGPVVSRSTNITSDANMQEFLCQREEETRKAFEMKYDSSVSGSEWVSIIKELSLAAVKFDLLSTSFKNTVKLDDIHSDDGEVVNRAGVFVMYNYARLATLMQHFSKAVAKGTYPSMPDFTEVNFKLLNEEGEWILLFNYLLPYSSLLKECVADLEKDLVKPNLLTHKICQFLLDLSRDLSSYYSRVHVLGEGLPHLLPLMYARLALLRAVQKLMEHGLQLLNIKPLSQL